MKRPKNCPGFTLKLIKIIPIFKRFVNSCCFSIKSLDKSYKIVVFSFVRVLLEFNVCIINSLFFFFKLITKCNYLIFKNIIIYLILTWIMLQYHQCEFECFLLYSKQHSNFPSKNKDNKNI